MRGGAAEGPLWRRAGLVNNGALIVSWQIASRPPAYLKRSPHENFIYAFWKQPTHNQATNTPFP